MGINISEEDYKELSDKEKEELGEVEVVSEEEFDKLDEKIGGVLLEFRDWNIWVVIS